MEGKRKTVFEFVKEIVSLEVIPGFHCANWVADLLFTTPESKLQKEFSTFGEVAEVKLVKDEITKKFKGYAFIQYTSQEDAVLALENMDHKVLDGRLIYVDITKLGKERFGGYPRTSGPPKQQPLPEQDELADCCTDYFLVKGWVGLNPACYTFWLELGTREPELDNGPGLALQT